MLYFTSFWGHSEQLKPF